MISSDPSNPVLPDPETEAIPLAQDITPIDEVQAVDYSQETAYQDQEIAPPFNLENIGQQEQGRGGKGLLMGCIIFFSLFICIVISLLIFGVFYLRDNYVPGISPYIEDYIMPADEQFSKRMDLIADAAAYSLLKADQDKLPFELQSDIKNEDLSSAVVNNIDNYLEDLNKVSYEINTKMHIESDESFIKEEDIDSVIKNEDISQLLQAKVIDLDLNLISNEDNSNKGNPISDSDIKIKAGTEGIELSAEAQIVLTNKDVYFLVKSFPDNAWINTESIKEKWVHYVLDDESLLNPLSEKFVNPSSGKSYEDFDFKNEDLDKIKQIFRTEAIKANIKENGKETIGDKQTKCYQINLDEDSFFDFVYEIQDIYEIKDLPERDEVEEAMDDSDVSINNIRFDMCFGIKDSMPYKIGIKVDVTSKETLFSYETTIKFWKLEDEQKIEEPSDNIIEFEDIDIDKIISDLGDTDTVQTGNSEEVDEVTDNVFDSSNINTCIFGQGLEGCTDCQTNGLDSPSCSSCEKAYIEFFAGRDPKLIEPDFDTKCYKH